MGDKLFAYFVTGVFRIASFYSEWNRRKHTAIVFLCCLFFCTDALFSRRKLLYARLKTGA